MRIKLGRSLPILWRTDGAVVDRSMERSISFQAVFLCFALFSNVGLAQIRMPAVVEWLCGLESLRAESIRCELSEPVPGYFVSVNYQSPDARRIMADLFRSGANSNIARLVREAPDRYAGESWWIPLYRPAEDLARVRELTESVMCGGDRACRVILVGRGFRALALGGPS